MLDIDKIRKVVINLKRRPDRLETFNQEMEFMGWDYEIFEGIDKKGYDGCALSHLKIVEDFINSNDEHIMILEDDCFFMPYAKTQLEKSLDELNNIEWDFFHLGPSLNRPVNNYSENLLDLSNLPEKEPHHRGIYNLACYVINRNFGEEILKFKLECQKAIDQYLDEDVFPNFKCLSTSIPIITQRSGFSDINQTHDNNHYMITYNWNLYTENKINTRYFDINYCEQEKNYPEIVTNKLNKIVNLNLPELEKKTDYKVKFITAIYSNLNGTELGGRPNRHGHYRWSLLSILKINNADFVCYTSDEEFDDLERFFYEENNISREKLQIVKFDLRNNEFSDIINKYKDVEGVKRGDRCIEIQYMKFIWFLLEDKSYDYYFWIDAGLSHCGLIPNKYLSLSGSHNRGYYESSLFNNIFLNNLLKKTGDKFSIIGKENERNFWSGTVNPKHFFNYDRSIHVIGGMFGGRKELWETILELFKDYVYKVSEEDKRLYHEEDIMTLMFRNHSELFYNFYFETWWHENERIEGTNMEEHVKNNKSFYKILEELNE
jgi:GR25 family glycosyltransferase involved in LPS biosynthesis